MGLLPGSRSGHFLRLCILVIVCMLPARPARAATITVTTLGDSGAGSLRDAVVSANAAADSDLIIFQDGLTGTITLTSGVLNITNPLEIRGPGADLLTVSGNDTSRVFQIGGTAVTIRGLAIRLGRSPLATGSQGGCIQSSGNLTLLECEISQCTAGANTAAQGGGIYSTGTLLMDECTVHNCLATANTFAAGGGICGFGGSLTVRRTTIHDNQVVALSGVNGGGIFVSSAGLMLENSTIAGNGGSAVQANAGGLWQQGGTLFVSHCTIAGNLAGPGLLLSSATGYLRNSLVASNSAGQFVLLSGSQIISLGNNLVSTGGGGLVHGVNGDQVGTGAAPIDPLLLPLGDYGGHTPTLALDPNSPAVDAGNPTQAPLTDQRGFDRNVDGNCLGAAPPDIGAFEYGAGDGLHFDGMNDLALVSFQPDLNLASAFTLEAWVRPRLSDSSFPVSRILSTRSSDNRGYGLGLVAGTPLFTTFGVQDFQATNVKLTGDVWTHIAVVFDSMFDASFYVNGVFVQKVDGVQAARMHMVPRPLYLGANPALDPQYWSGALDEVRIWNSERTPAQIAKFFDMALAGDETGLVAYWRLNEGTGSRVFDHTFRGHEGDLFNEPYWLSTACIPDACVAGDANDDGIVTLMDHRIFAMNLGRHNATLRLGDFDGDADVDLRDFATLQLHYGLSCQ